MVKAIKDVHASGIVHRDIKPRNICISTNQNENGVTDLKLIDFGIAKSYRDDLGIHIPNSKGRKFCGTAEFTSFAAHNGSG